MEKETFSPQLDSTTQMSALGQQRRKMLKIFGASTALIGLAAACKKSSSGTSGTASVSLGSGDTGILNYAYALEQLEAAFYKKVMDALFGGINPIETSLLTDIRD